MFRGRSLLHQIGIFSVFGALTGAAFRYKRDYRAPRYVHVVERHIKRAVTLRRRTSTSCAASHSCFFTAFQSWPEPLTTYALNFQSLNPYSKKCLDGLGIRGCYRCFRCAALLSGIKFPWNRFQILLRGSRPGFLSGCRLLRNSRQFTHCWRFHLPLTLDFFQFVLILPANNSSTFVSGPV